MTRPISLSVLSLRAIAYVILFAFLSHGIAFAELLVLAGAVHDSSGAGIPKALIAVTNPTSGAKFTAASAADGSFSIPVAEGSYTLEISAPGFRPLMLQSVRPSQSRIDAALQLNSNHETVTVEATSAAIDTTGTEVGGSINSKTIVSVPLNGRSFTDLLAMQAGVVPASSQQPNAVVMSGCTSTPPSGDLNPGNMSVSGQRETSNGFVVNGSSVEEDFNNGTAVIPNLDSIAELKVLTGNFNAEYGNFSGGQVMVVTKSGTDQIHGSSFEFFRNAALDGRGYFDSDRARYDRNQFGGTLGGPIRKGSSYFFIDYQGTRMAQGVDTGVISVPNLAERGGDLASVANSLSGTVSSAYWAGLLSSKLHYNVAAGEPYYLAGCANVAQCVFPGAVIPQSAWSEPAQHLLQYIPVPNTGSSSFSSSSSNEGLRDDKGSARIDVATRLGSLSAYYFADDYSLDNPYPTGQGGANVPGFNAQSFGRAQLISLSLVKTFGARAINELHFSYMRSANDIGHPVGGVGPSLASQGFVEGAGTLGIVPLEPQIEGIENVSLNDFTFGVDTTGLKQVNNTLQWSDNYSRVIGRHTLKLGVDFHTDQVNINPDATFNGSFLFQGTETGLDFADFLLGVASNYAQGDSLRFYLRSHYIGAYAQDAWQLRRNLVLNYGLRWDVLPPWSEKYNQLQTLVLGEQSRVFPGAPSGLVFPGDPGIPNTLAPTKYANFAPRLGLNYSPSPQKETLAGKLLGAPGKTSIRAAFGLFSTAFEGLSAGIMSANPPYGYDYDSTGGRPLFATPFVSASTGQSFGQPFPSPIPPFGASASNPNNNIDWSKYLPITGVPSFYYRNVPPYSESYSLSIERQLGGSTLLKLGYVGSQAHRLLVVTSANPGNAALCLSVSQPSQVLPGTQTCGPFSEGGIFTRANGSQLQVRGPFSAAFDAITYQKTIGNSNYNGLQIELRHSSGNLEFLASYTYSKTLDDSSSLAEPVNPFNVNLTHAVSAFDLRQDFVVSYKYHLPFAAWSRRGQRWTDGWSLSGLTRFASGLPVTLFNNNDTSLLGSIPNGVNNNGVDTPNYTPGDLALNLNPRNGRPLFNPALFSLPAPGELGNARRRFFYGPGIENFDMALAKELRLTDTKKLELRMEAFNAFNHSQFFGAAAVNGNISSSNFGQVVNSMPARNVQLAVRFAF